MIFAIGILLALVVVLTIGRFWLAGHWLACSLMFFPATIVAVCVLGQMEGMGTDSGAWAAIYIGSLIIGFCVAKAPQWYRRRQSEG